MTALLIREVLTTQWTAKPFSEEKSTTIEYEIVGGRRKAILNLTFKHFCYLVERNPVYLNMENFI